VKEVLERPDHRLRPTRAKPDSGVNQMNRPFSFILVWLALEAVGSAD
jgi:hypothetical protein